MLELAKVGSAPQFFAVEVIAVHAGRGETDDDAFTIADRRGVAVPVFIPVLFLLAVGHVLLPQDFALGSVEAEQASGRASLAGLSEKDLVAPDDRSGVSGMIERGLPLDVLSGAPFEWKVFLRAMALAP